MYNFTKNKKRNHITGFPRIRNDPRISAAGGLRTIILPVGAARGGGTVDVHNLETPKDLGAVVDGSPIQFFVPTFFFLRQQQVKQRAKFLQHFCK